MTFPIDGSPVNFCRPHLREHVWTWSNGDTLGGPFPDQLCICGAFKYKNRDILLQDIENAAIEDSYKLESAE